MCKTIDKQAHEFVIYTDGSATMTDLSPREAVYAGWWLAILHRSAAGRMTWSWSLSAPIQLGSTGTNVLGATRLTNNAAELTALLAALTWRATLPGWVRVMIVSDSKVSIDLVERRARASTNAALDADMCSQCVAPWLPLCWCTRTRTRACQAMRLRMPWRKLQRTGLPGQRERPVQPMKRTPLRGSMRKW